MENGSLILKIDLLRLMSIICAISCMVHASGSTVEYKDLSFSSIGFSTDINLTTDYEAEFHMVEVDDSSEYRNNDPIEPNIIFRNRNTAIKTDPFSPRRIAFHVKGLVLDEESQPLIGVNILEKGTTNGTTTDIDGKFELTVLNENSVIQLSYIGFQSIEIEVDGRKEHRVTMVQDYKELEEVVVVGYGIIQKSDVTGAVSKLEPDDMTEHPVISMEQYIQGRVSGVQIIQNNGALGSEMTFRIRGATSITGSTQPLIVIDGYPIDNSPDDALESTGDPTGAMLERINPLAHINPNDIESIEILKDASSIALYGSRGANGVVLITTKSGGKGRDKVELTTRFDQSEIMREIDVLDPWEYMSFQNEGALNDGLDSVFNENELMSTLPNNNWQDLIFQKGRSSETQAAIYGGDDDTKYRLGLNYLNGIGIVKTSKLRRGSLSFNFDHDISSRFRVGLKTIASLTHSNQVHQGSSSLAGSMVVSALFLNPLSKVFIDPFDPDEFNIDLSDNPVTLLEKKKDFGVAKTLVINSFAEYELAKGLKTKINAGVNSYDLRREVFWPLGTRYGNNVNERAQLITTGRFNYLTELQLSYIGKIGSSGRVNAILVGSHQHWKSERENLGYSDFGVHGFGVDNLNLANGATPARNSKDFRALTSFIGRVNYSIAGKYILNVTGRYDGTSLLPSSNRWAFFPSVGVGWNLDNEKIFREIEVLSRLKLRASYGVAGNQSIRYENTLATYEISRRTYGANKIGTALIPGNFANPNLKWENTYQWNLGLDIGLKNDRLQFGAEIYRKRTKDLLVYASLPLSTGFEKYEANNGELLNEGLEVEVMYSIFQKQDFDWLISGNISFNENEIIDLGVVDAIYGPSYLTGELGTYIHIAKPGYPIGSFWGYTVDGLYQNQSEVDEGPEDFSNPKPGDYKFRDLNGDGAINPDDISIIGNPYPKYVFGLSNDINFKNISFNILVTGAIDFDIANLSGYRLNGNAAFRNHNIATNAFENAWRGEGTSDFYPRVSKEKASGGYNRFTNLSVNEGTYIRVKNVSLGYTIPFKKLGVSSVKFFASATNLFTITDYPGFDPEVNSHFRSAISPGLDYGTIPQTRSYSTGLTFSF